MAFIDHCNYLDRPSGRHFTPRITSPCGCLCPKLYAAPLSYLDGDCTRVGLKAHALEIQSRSQCCQVKAAGSWEERGESWQVCSSPMPSCFVSTKVGLPCTPSSWEVSDSLNRGCCLTAVRFAQRGAKPLRVGGSFLRCLCYRSRRM